MAAYATIGADGQIGKLFNTQGIALANGAQIEISVIGEDGQLIRVAYKQQALGIEQYVFQDGQFC